MCELALPFKNVPARLMGLGFSRRPKLKLQILNTTKQKNLPYFITDHKRNCSTGE